MDSVVAGGRDVSNETNKLYPIDRSVHEWYRFVLSFPAHLVREYLERFNIDEKSRVLDPFCGTGTVLVECKKQGIPSEGVEINPMAHFATKVKTDWSPEPDRLIEHARQIASVAAEILMADGIEDNPFFDITYTMDHPLRTLTAEETELLLSNSISPLPLHKALILLECIKENAHQQYTQHELLAFAKSVVYSSSNLRFGPEVGIGPIKTDAPVISSWLSNVQAMVTDLRNLKGYTTVPSHVHLQDSRNISQILEPHSIDAVITSPPYPNEKDYTRTTRLESVLLGFIHNKADLQAIKKALVCSNTRTVYKGDTDDHWVKEYSEVKNLAKIIEAKRIELGKTSGFEKLYAKVTELYFGGMARHLAFLRTILRPGAHLAYVVGDQASYFRVMIPTGKILAEIGQSLGYEVTGIDLFRNRFSTATKEQLREEVVILRWPEKSIGHKIVELPRMTSPLNSKNDRGSTVDNFLPEDKHSSDSEAMDSSSEDLSATEEGPIDISSPPSKKLNRYQKIMDHIFFSKYSEGAHEVAFEREDLRTASQTLNIKLPDNLGDVMYSFRYRTMLPESIRAKAPEGMEWTISPSGRSRYCFVAKSVSHIVPNPLMAVIKIPDATPGIVAKYALGDEQSLLAKLRYNRLIDIFTHVTCYSLQNHLRTAIKGIGQVETDEIYVGVDRDGVQYVFPLQAKGGNDKIGIIQIEQDVALCAIKFPQLVCRPLAAQFIGDNHIALFEFTQSEDGIGLPREVHYRLVTPENMTEEDLSNYRKSAGNINKN
ncbi:MAG: hypothetical protein JO031_06910 [Ktedonobacteraceae bacterium]|nr:hypothetical protein [Ktedonobacteraceae bacterium]